MHYSSMMFNVHKGLHTRGDCSLWLVPATSREDKSHHVTLVPATIPTNSNQFEILGQVPATCSSKRFVWTVHGTSPYNQSLHVTSSGDQLQGLAAGTSPLACVDLKSNQGLGILDMTFMMIFFSQKVLYLKYYWSAGGIKQQIVGTSCRLGILDMTFMTIFFSQKVLYLKHY